MVMNQKSAFWKGVEYACYIFVATFPFINFAGFLYSGTSTRSVSLIALASFLGLLISFWLFSNQKNVLSIPKAPIILSLVIYMAFLFLSAIQGLNLSTSFWSVVTRTTGLWYLLNLGFFMLVLWQILIDQKRQMMMILTVVYSMTLYSILSLLGPEGIGIIFKDYPFDGFTFGNSTFAAMYIFGAFMLAVYYVIQSSDKKWWMYLLPIIIVINPNIINRDIWFGRLESGLVGEARASAFVIGLSVLGLLVVWGVSKIKNRKYKIITSYGLFCLGLMLMISSAFSLITPDGFLNKLYLSQATAVRPLVWASSLEAAKQRPFLGWGSENFERVFEKNYDNRILQQEYGNEAWLDRAHNVFVDLLVDNGFIGLIMYLLIYCVIILSLLYSVFKTKDKQDMILASVLLVYFPLHILELQTAFDTSISYIILALMTVLSGVIFERTVKNTKFVFVVKDSLKYVGAIILLLASTASISLGLFPLVNAQVANGDIREVGSSVKRLPLYPALFSSSVDKHSFVWRIMTDFQRGIGDNPAVLNDVKKVEGLKQEMIIFEKEYRDFLIENPTHFRGHLSLADVLIYYRLFGVDKLEEAQKTLDQAIVLVPQSPQPYWMKAVAYVYMGKFDLAREYANKGLALNPKIKQSQDIVDYVEKSAKTFPEIDLFFFKQI